MPVGSGAAGWNWFGEGNWPLTTGSTSRATPCDFALEIDLDRGGVERIEAHFDGFAGQMRRGFVEAVLQQERAVAAHQAIQAMKEEAAQIGGGRQLADVLDVALPTHQRGGPQSAVFGAVIGIVDPGPQALVEIFQRERLFAIQVGQKLFAERSGSSVRFFRGLRADTAACARSGCRWKRRCAPVAGRDRSWRCPCRAGRAGRGRRWLGADSPGRHPGPGWYRTGRAG